MHRRLLQHLSGTRLGGARGKQQMIQVAAGASGETAEHETTGADERQHARGELGFTTGAVGSAHHDRLALPIAARVHHGAIVAPRSTAPLICSIAKPHVGVALEVRDDHDLPLSRQMHHRRHVPAIRRQAGSSPETARSVRASLRRF